MFSSSSKCFSGKSFKSAVTYNAARGRIEAGCRMRLSSLPSKALKICFRYKYNFAPKPWEEVNGGDGGGISDKSKSFVKLQALLLLGYKSIHDSNKNEGFLEMSNTTLDEGMCDFDFSVTCKRFRSIIFGSSPHVELYTGTSCEPESMNILAAKWVDADFPFQARPSLCSPLPDFNAPLSSQSVTLETDKNLDPVQCSTQLELELKNNATVVELFFDKSVSCIPGLKKKQQLQLEEHGFHTFRKLFRHFPRTYADLQNAHVGIIDGQYMIFCGQILSSRGIKTSGAFSFLEVIVGCEIVENELDSKKMITDIDSQGKKTIYLHLKKFFSGAQFSSLPFLRNIENKYKKGDYACVSGKVRTMSRMDHYEMREYELDVLEDAQSSSVCTRGRPYPIYPSKRSLKPNILRDIISRALLAMPENVDPLPENVTHKFGLLRLHDAYAGIHQPKDLNEAELARKRLVFDEFFYIQIGRLFQMLEEMGTQSEKDQFLDKYKKPDSKMAFAEEWSGLTKLFLKGLKYSLTSSQMSAALEIIWDLKHSVPTNRLLQGDVGCGKTVVALLACMEVIGSGYQAAFMAPTELLAVQHYEHLLQLLENLEDAQSKPSIALLTGSTPSKQACMIREGLQTGDISMVIGTHSLISESVEFLALRIAVVDEQHRFGVIQRGRFASKLRCVSKSSRMSSSSGVCDGYNMAPHILSLSATPIPRTLVLALYGDMPITQITELPPGRTPVETHVFEANENGFEEVYKMMLDDLQARGKIFVVYPVIDQSDRLPQLRAATADFKTISCKFTGHCCGLLHGKMKSNEKDEVLRRFRCGETSILLSTLVIEAGIDIPDASMVVVMNAERFGIAQLHQMRGRVGRGSMKSKCILVASGSASLNRLKVLQESSDGFYLANMDLFERGPGDLAGTKQSGHLPVFFLARLETDGNILENAHLAALEILSTSSDLKQFPGLKAELSMRYPLCLLGA